MPPKPSIRIPRQAPPLPAPRAPPHPFKLARPVPQTAQKPQARHPQAYTSPGPSTHERWYENPKVRRGARYVVWGSNVVALWCALIFVRDNYIRFDAIRGSSMAPTLNPNTHETGRRDLVFFMPYWQRFISLLPEDKQERYQGRLIQRGDVVTFWKPHKPEEVSIKRVVAIEGDTVYPKRGYALDPEVVFGKRLQGMPDGLPDDDEDSVLAGRNQLGKIVVPYGYVWVEGDNARQSLDSNDFGPISKSLIKEKAVWIWREWTEFMRIEDKRSRKEKEMGSMVVPGNKCEVPEVFL